ncbi:MAG TPA: hypothetical protein VNU97_18895 [Rhizomicrobium sp.]|jgi:hypothetical protein|nr:hypothetical protein [Rhizomicrobium sp.]
MIGSWRLPEILEMPFAIMLMPADVSAPPPHYKIAIERAVQANGGRLGPHGVVRLADGGQLIFENSEFWLKQLTPGICRVVFDTALRTNTYVSNGGSGSDLVPLKLKGSTLKTPPDLGRAVVVANPVVLCTKLQSRLTHWNQETERLRREGVIGADDQPLEPPPDPGTEPRLSGDPSGIAARCEASTRERTFRLGWKFVRGMITQNAQWGIVWRADVAPETDPATWFRDSCWRVPGTHGKGGISISSRPLMMFDKTKNTKPLPAN